MQKAMKKWLSILFICMAFMMIPSNIVEATTETVVIEAADGAELYTLVEEAVKNGGTKIQVNVSGTLNFETFASHSGDRLVKLEGIEELTIVGTTPNAKFVQTGIGVNDMSVNGGKLIFKDITIEDTTVYESERGETAWEFCYAEYGGNVEFNNCVIRGEYGGIMTNGNATFINCQLISEKDSSHGGDNKEYAVWVNKGSATFIDCVVTGNRGIKVHEDYGTEITSIVVDSCMFIDITQKPGIVIGTLNEETEITIKDCGFYGCQPGDNGLYSYESDTDVSIFDMKFENDVVCNNHELKKVESVDATCTEDGNITYWTCEDCESKYSDEKGMNIISDVSKEAVGHILNHYEAKDMIPCQENGWDEYWYCDTCEKYFTDKDCINESAYEDLIIDCGKHEFKEVKEVPASYTDNGVKAHVVCSNCGEIRLTQDGKVVDKSALIIPQLVKVEEGKEETVNNETKNADTNSESSTPKTGDNIVVWFSMLFVSVIGLIATVVFFKRKA